jgi:hypothetical protein
MVEWNGLITLKHFHFVGVTHISEKNKSTMNCREVKENLAKKILQLARNNPPKKK